MPIRKSKEPRQNGVLRPREQSITRFVWDMCNYMSAKVGRPIEKNAVLEQCLVHGVAEGTVTSIYGKWAKFHGIALPNNRGRKKENAPPEHTPAPVTAHVPPVVLEPVAPISDPAQVPSPDSNVIITPEMARSYPAPQTDINLPPATGFSPTPVPQVLTSTPAPGLPQGVQFTPESIVHIEPVPQAPIEHVIPYLQTETNNALVGSVGMSSPSAPAPVPVHAPAPSDAPAYAATYPAPAPALVATPQPVSNIPSPTPAHVAGPQDIVIPVIPKPQPVVPMYEGVPQSIMYQAVQGTSLDIAEDDEFTDDPAYGSSAAYNQQPM